MDAALEIRKHFGTVQDMMTKIKATKLKYGTMSTQLSKVLEDSTIILDDTQETRIVKAIDSALDDYKDDSCKRKMEALVKESKSNRTNPHFVLVGLFFSLSLFYQVV